MSNNCRVLYRLPGADHYVRLSPHDRSTESLGNMQELSGRSGFVFAPFTPTNNIPILLFPENKAEIIHTPIPPLTPPKKSEKASPPRPPADRQEEYNNYAKTFQHFHHQLTDGTFNKIVLARHTQYKVIEQEPSEQLFLRACQRYPNAYIALITTPDNGTWLISTPELLLEINGRKGKTMALAGTIPNTQTPNWSKKNTEEQQIVTRYIADTLQSFASHIDISQPHTVKAGKVMHLQTDIHFTLREKADTIELIEQLHPTPAVCGLPKAAARQFITDNEPFPRLYYSGFSGILGAEGETKLYVSLRCMQITNQQLRLFAGGGLLKESEVESEWRETEAKMTTMRQLFENTI